LSHVQTCADLRTSEPSLGHPKLHQELEERLAAQLPAGHCVKGSINVPQTSYAAGPGWIKYLVGYQTEPCPD